MIVASSGMPVAGRSWAFWQRLRPSLSAPPERFASSSRHPSAASFSRIFSSAPGASRPPGAVARGTEWSPPLPRWCVDLRAPLPSCCFSVPAPADFSFFSSCFRLLLAPARRWSSCARSPRRSHQRKRRDQREPPHCWAPFSVASLRGPLRRPRRRLRLRRPLVLLQGVLHLLDLPLRLVRGRGRQMREARRDPLDEGVSHHARAPSATAGRPDCPAAP